MREKAINGGYITKAGVLYDITPHHEVSVMGYSGHAVIIKFLEGTVKMLVNNDSEGELCLLDKGHHWLVFYPENEFWALTAFYDENGIALQWYFDITKSKFIDENGIPTIDDLYLDIVLMPDGRIIILDEDELLEAHVQGEITDTELSHAYRQCEKLKKSVLCDVGFITHLCSALLAQF